MKRKQLFLILSLLVVLCFFIGSGCGSSDTSGPSFKYEPITSDEGAFITRDDVLHNNITVIDTENSVVRCDSSGNDCYSFATRYYELGSQTSVAIIDSSGNRIFFDFTNGFSEKTVYEYIAGVNFLNQDLLMYVSYDSHELSCGEGCQNVYHYDNRPDCDSSIEACKYYKVTLLKNNDEYLEFVFSIWNNYFLDVSEVRPEVSRAAVFQGYVKVKKDLHNGSENYYYPRED